MDNIKKLKKESENINIPEECPENDKALKTLADETKTGHYDNINLLVLAALLIFTAVTFLAVNGGNSSDGGGLVFNLKSFVSGAYTQSLENRYNDQLPVPETFKAIEERVSLLYGIGNKLSDPIKTVDDGTNADRNSFDEPSDNNKDKNENVITSTAPQTDKNGNTTTSKKNEKDNGKGTTAVDRPGGTTSTTTTTAETTTTNNDAPDVTVTTTVPVPDVTTTTPPATSETTQPTEPVPTETTTSETTAQGGDNPTDE